MYECTNMYPNVQMSKCPNAQCPCPCLVEVIRDLIRKACVAALHQSDVELLSNEIKRAVTVVRSTSFNIVYQVF